jgi:hypothetical protein
MTAGHAAARRRWEEQQRIYRRRRVLALIGGTVLLLLLVRGCSAVVGGGGDEASQAAASPELPRGGRLVLPVHRVVAYYGAPQRLSHKLRPVTAPTSPHEPKLPALRA